MAGALVSRRFGMYRITFSSRYFRWLPWPKQHMLMEKPTTWAEAHHFAASLAENGAENVVVVRVGDA